MHARTRTVLITLVLLSCSLTTNAQDVQPVTGMDGTADRLRELAYQRDYESVVLEGEQMRKDDPENIKRDAWYALGLARSGQQDEAIALAGELQEKAPENVWSHFAIAAARSWGSEPDSLALVASERALQLEPAHPDVLWMHVEVLLNHARTREAVSFVDASRGLVDNPAELLTLKGYALNTLSRSSGQTDPAKVDSSLATYEEARRLDSSSVAAHYLPALSLFQQRKIAETYALLERAAELAPTSIPVHRMYWRAAHARTDVDPEENRAKVSADIQAFLERRSDVSALATAAVQYGAMGDKEKKRELEERVVSMEPYGSEAESIIANRWREIESEYADSLMKIPEAVAEYRRHLTEFVQRPKHENEHFLGEAYMKLVQLAQHDSTVSGAELLRLVQGMVEHESLNPHFTYAQGAKTLAERTAYYREAEAIARKGIDAGRARVGENKDAYETNGDYERALNWMTGLMYDALGWVFFQEGNLDEAENQLLISYELNPESADVLFHLGALYEARHAGKLAPQAVEVAGRQTRDFLDLAEEFYIKGALVQTPGENPNRAALRNLYEKRNGSGTGYEEYYARIAEIDRSSRKEKVLSERIAEPESIPEFALEQLSGDTLRTEDLNGKIAVINFWGIWCGWCIKEMPDYQALADQYSDDPGVLILTINNDQNRGDVQPWMEEHAYTFPVLFDAGFVSAAGVSAFPTTWFVDRDGRIAFKKKGWSEKLAEEFSWRIEALREEL